MSDKVKGFVPKTFSDSGTKQSFEGGRVHHDVGAGAFANYKAAGKMREPTDEELAADVGKVSAPLSQNTENAADAPAPAGGKSKPAA